MTRSQFLIPLACLLVIGGVALLLRPNPEVQKRDVAQAEQPHIQPIPEPPARPATKPTGKPQPEIAIADFPPQTAKFNPPLPKTAQQPQVGAEAKIAGGPKVVTEALERPLAPALPETVSEKKTTKLPKGPADSSYENPFTEDLWESTGWKFAPRGMETVGSASSSATFARSYQKIMLECDILGVGNGEAHWELRLATQNGASMSIIIHPDRISVHSKENDVSKLVVEKPVTSQLLRGVPRQFRIVATGNRIVVSWDRRRLLTTEQIAAQSGHDIILSIHTEGAAFHIPRMRIEGD